jgi:hypothetical protein
MKYKWLALSVTFMCLHVSANLQIPVNITFINDSKVVKEKCNGQLACAEYKNNICLLTAMKPMNFNDYLVQEAMGKAYMNCVTKHETNNK